MEAQITIHIPWFEIVLFISICAAMAILYKFSLSAFSKPYPSGPGSIGRALGFLGLAEALGSFLVWYLFRAVSWLLSIPSLNEYESVAALAIQLVAVFVAGILSARTAEETKGMNLKLFVVAGFFPHTLVTFVYYQANGLFETAFWAYAPVVIAGGIVQIRFLHARNTEQSPELESAS